MTLTATSSRRTGAKLLGFEGKWCIHPNQIEWANAEFTPSRKLYDEAEGACGPTPRRQRPGAPPGSAGRTC